jgi:hypothetical protein
MSSVILLLSTNIQKFRLNYLTKDLCEYFLFSNEENNKNTEGPTTQRRGPSVFFTIFHKILIFNILQN